MGGFNPSGGFGSGGGGGGGTTDNTTDPHVPYKSGSTFEDSNITQDPDGKMRFATEIIAEAGIDTIPATITIGDALKVEGSGGQQVNRSAVTGKRYQVLYQEVDKTGTQKSFQADAEAEVINDIRQGVSNTVMTSPLTFSYASPRNEIINKVYLQTDGDVTNFRYQVTSIATGEVVDSYPDKFNYQKDEGINIVGAGIFEIDLYYVGSSSPNRYLDGDSYEITIKWDSGNLLGDATNVPYYAYDYQVYEFVDIAVDLGVFNDYYPLKTPGGLETGWLRYNQALGRNESTLPFFAPELISESNTIKVGPAISLKERGGFLQQTSNMNGKDYVSLDYEVDATGSQKPRYARRDAEAIRDIIQPIDTTTMNNVTTYVVSTTTSSDVAAVYYKFVNPVDNFRLRVTSQTTGEVIKFIPTETDWNEGTGISLAAGERKIDLGTPLAEVAGIDITVDIMADQTIDLLGDGVSPWRAIDSQDITSFDIPYIFDDVATRNLYESSTRIKSGFAFLLDGANSFSVGNGELEYFDPLNYSTDESSAYTVTFTEQTGITPAFTLPQISYVTVNSLGALMQRNRAPSNTERRSEVMVAAIASDGVNILQSDGIRDTFNQVGNQVIDFMRAIGNIKVSGLELSPSGANLKLNHAAGEIFGESLNWTDITDPHTVEVIAQSPIPNITVYLGNGTLQSTGANDVFPTEYNPNGGNTFVALPGGVNTAQIVQIYVRPATGEILYLPGQDSYTSVNTAIDAFPTYRPIVPDIVSLGAVKIGSLIMRKGALDLLAELVAGDLIIVDAEKFGDINPLARTGSDIEPTPLNRHFVYYDAGLNKLVDSGDVSGAVILQTNYSIPNEDCTARYIVENVASDITITLPPNPNKDMQYEFINSKRFLGGWGVSGFNVIITWNDGVDDYFVTLNPDQLSGTLGFESYLFRYDFNKWGFKYNG